MESKQLNIAVLTGYWSTNIGNAFFQLGAVWALQQALPGAHVFPIGDQPGYWNVKRGNHPNALDYVKHLDVDAIVVLGPYCRPEMEGIVGEALRAQHRKGAKVIVMAAGMMAYDKDTIALSRRLMSDTPPFIFTTRDSETFEALGDIAEHAYDGIDVATFVSDLFPKVPTDLPPYIALNFDQIPEPAIATVESLGRNPKKDAKLFELFGKQWAAEQPKLRTELWYKSRAFGFGEAFLPMPRRATELDGRQVVRTDHRYNPFLPKKSYKAPRTYVGDVPYSYLNIYANADATISNRVHACVATVSYGNPAMLFTRSPRAYLLKRLGLDTIKQQPTSIDMEFLKREKAALIAFLRESLASLEPRS